MNLLRPTEIARNLLIALDGDRNRARGVALTCKDKAADELWSVELGSAAEAEALKRHRYWVAVTLRIDRIVKLTAARAARTLA